MMRFFAGVAACFLMMTGAFLLWQGKAQEPGLPPAPAATAEAPILAAPAARNVLRAPEATPKSREQKRFARADKDDDGRITSAELFEPRHKAFAKLDKNGNGALSFDEGATKTVEKSGLRTRIVRASSPPPSSPPLRRNHPGGRQPAPAKVVFRGAMRLS